MSDYIGKICPYCKTELKAEDDVVVCSACEMPHHKECWVENQGCTTFGCTGTIQGADAPAAAQPAAVFCSACGQRNVGNSAFCTHCGRPLAAPAVQQPVYTPPVQPVQPPYQPVQPTYQQPVQPTYQQPVQPTYQQPAQPTYQQPVQPQQPYQPPVQPPVQPQYPPQGGYNAPYGTPYSQPTVDPVVSQLVGKKQEYFIPKFTEMKAQNKKTTWNWPAFLTCSYWMLYRKMYLYGGLLAVAELIVSWVGLWWLSLAGCIAIGLFGNYLYMQDLEKKANEARGMTDYTRPGYIAQNGGVNSGIVIGVLIARVVLAALML